MKKQMCLVCKKHPSKYKCPTCLTPFCSVSCNQTHKTTSCKTAPASPKPSTPLPPPRHRLPAKRRAPFANQEEEALLTNEQLQQLDGDEEVCRKVRDARIQAAIQRINNAKDSSQALRKEMEDPGFLELCDDVLAALGVNDQKE